MAGRKSHYVFEYRFTILGSENVGKSAIVQQFMENRFSNDYVSTTENHLTHIIEYEEMLCVCLMVDTSGSDDFPAMRKLSITKGNAFVVVYAINNRKSFERAKLFVNEIKRLKSDASEIKIVFVGNKSDLEKEREVSYEEGYEYANGIHEGNIVSSFTESTAKSYMSVENVFHKMLRLFTIPPAQIEVPVLMERSNENKQNNSKGKVTRKTSKGLIQRKSSRTNTTKKLQKNQSLSDSETEATRPRSKSLTSPRLPFRLSKKHSEGNNDEHFSAYELWDGSGSPNCLRYKNRRVSADTVTHISNPKLVSHSCPLYRYNLQNKSPFSISSDSSDSGVSDGCQSPELSPRRSKKSYTRSFSCSSERTTKRNPLNRYYTVYEENYEVSSRDLNDMHPRTQSTSVVHVSSPTLGLIRRSFTVSEGMLQPLAVSNVATSLNSVFEEAVGKTPSISDKMRGIFRKKKASSKMTLSTKEKINLD